MEIYSAGGKKLDTVLSLIDKLRPKSSRPDNFYNSMRLTQTLLHKNMGVCGTLKVNKGIPRDLDGAGKSLKAGQSAYRRKGDVVVQVWKGKTSAKDKYDP